MESWRVRESASRKVRNFLINNIGKGASQWNKLANQNFHFLVISFTLLWKYVKAGREGGVEFDIVIFFTLLGKYVKAGRGRIWHGYFLHLTVKICQGMEG